MSELAVQYLKVARVKEDGKSPIVAIAERWLDERGVLKIHTAWSHPRGERGIVEDFLSGSHFWSNKWTYVPAGVRMQPQLGALWHAAMKYGLLEFGADPWKEKPTLDLHPVLALLNSDHVRPDGAYGDAPPLFYGASLEKFTFRNLDSQSVGALVAAKQYDAALNIMRAEANAFWDFYQTISSALIVVRESIIRPAFMPPELVRPSEA